MICTPGATQRCVCFDGEGVQTCSGDGKSWGVCFCGDGEADADADNDVDSDVDLDSDGGSDSDVDSERVLPPPDCEVVDCDGPPYPRTACWAWGGMSPDWAARFDLVVMWRDDRTARAIREIDPYTIILPTEDWNYGGTRHGHLPDEWVVHRPDGSLQEVYCTGCDEYLVDFTDCRAGPEGCGLHEGMRFTDSLIDDLEEWNIDLYDGISTNGFWNHAGPWGPLSGGIDLDRNGVNDYEEHGEGWVDELWTEATMEFISRLWERIGSDNYMVINSGSSTGGGGTCTTARSSRGDGPYEASGTISITPTDRGWRAPANRICSSWTARRHMSSMKDPPIGTRTTN